MDEAKALKLKQYAKAAAKKHADVQERALTMMTALEGELTESILDAEIAAAKAGAYDKVDLNSVAAPGTETE